MDTSNANRVFGWNLIQQSFGWCLAEGYLARVAKSWDPKNGIRQQIWQRDEETIHDPRMVMPKRFIATLNISWICHAWRKMTQMTNHFRRLSRPIQADPDDMRHLHISRILSPNGEPNFEKPMTDMSKKWLEKYYDVPSNSWRSIQFMCIYLYIYNMLYIYIPHYIPIVSPL